ncbi:MAG: S66 peptidase family protein [Bacteroidota bacterium]
MKLSRRAFLPALATLGAGIALSKKLSAGENEILFPQKDLPVIKPPALKKGDKIAITSPAGALRDHKDADKFQKLLEELGFEVVMGMTVKAKHGYFSGTDDMRLNELHKFFSDKSIKGIVCMKGGYGCARIIDKIDYEMIRNNPKIFMGFSDITALIHSIYHYSGLITFHGPVGNSSWNEYSINYITKTIITGEKVKYFPGNDAINDKITTLVPGKAEGKIAGGNLSVLCSLAGTTWFPETEGRLLFLEDVSEEPYRLDRMLTQLKLMGVFDKISGLILGKFPKCVAEEPDFAFTIPEVFYQQFSKVKFPVYSGAMIGHVANKYTLPVGIEARMDADKGTIELLEEAVVK